MPKTNQTPEAANTAPVTHRSRSRRIKSDDYMYVNAEPYLHGTLRTEELDAGWFRPWRFAYQQVRALTSTMAWRPGLYRYMAETGAGIYLEFLTDASVVGIELKLDDEPQGTTDNLNCLEGNERDMPHDGFSLDCDDTHLPIRWPLEGEERIMFDLAENGPLKEGEHHVRIWLPWGRGCDLRDIVCDGSYVTAVDQRPYLFVIGDSVAQGFVVDDPAHTWPALVADELGLDHINQGLGGQIFQSSSLADLKEIRKPEAVLVALGTNYAFAPYNERVTSRDATEFFDRLARTFPDTPVYVATPLWIGPHTELHPRSSIRMVPEIIANEVSKHDGWMLVDGQKLMAHGMLYLADGGVHPNVRGAQEIATSWAIILDDFRQTSRKETVQTEEPEPQAEEPAVKPEEPEAKQAEANPMAESAYIPKPKPAPVAAAEQSAEPKTAKPESKPAAELTPKPATEPTPKPAAEPTPKPAAELSPKPEPVKPATLAPRSEAATPRPKKPASKSVPMVKIPVSSENQMALFDLLVPPENE